MQNPTTIAVFGAGGNMGTRVTNALKDEPGYRMLNVEKSEQGRTRLRERGSRSPSKRMPCGMPTW